MNFKLVSSLFATLVFSLIFALGAFSVQAGGETNKFSITKVSTTPCTSSSCSQITTVIIDGKDFPNDAKVEADGLFDGRVYRDTDLNKNGFPYVVISGKTGSTEIIVDFNSLPCFEPYAVSVYSGLDAAYSGDMHFVTTNSCIVSKLELTHISPRNPRQGDMVTLQGTGFDPNPANDVVFVGNVPMPTQFNTLSKNGKILTFMLTTETPFIIGGVYPVFVKTPDGPLLSNSLELQVTSPTRLTKIDPHSGVPGTLVTIQGINFGTVQGSVFFLGSDHKFLANVTIKNWTDNAVTIVTPNLPTNQKYFVVVNGSYGGKFIYSSNQGIFKILTPKTPKK